MRTLFALLALLSLSACAPRGLADPEQTLRAFEEATARGDSAAAYALLDARTRARVSLEEFSASRAANAAELEEALAALAAREGRPTTEALVTLPGADPLLLRLEDGGYRLEGGVLDLVAPTSPEAAVLALRQALRDRSLPALLRVLSRRTRAELEAELDELLLLSGDRLDVQVEEAGDRAQIRLGTDRVLELVREGGEWRVDDLR